MRKTLTYSSFLVASLIVIVAFVTATTYTQLAIAIILYPLIAYFAFKILPRNWKTPIISVQLPVVRAARKAEPEVVESKKEDVKITDIDKRAFLKLVGATGISLFLYSILTRRPQVPFLGTGSPGTTALEDFDGNKVNPTEKQPMDGYRISEIDEDDVTTFYGFTNKDGGWIIMKEDLEGSFRYIKGDSGFPSSWARRKQLRYDYFHNVF